MSLTFPTRLTAKAQFPMFLTLEEIRMAIQAFQFADAAHMGQVRKYTGEPYIVHPLEVARLTMIANGATIQMYQAAMLHDTVEDCDVSIASIENIFGSEVAEMVWGLTDQSTKEMGNRAVRKAYDRDRLAYQSAQVQTIKVADLINNTVSIVEHDEAFAKVYIREKMELLEVLTKADPGLRAYAQAFCWETAVKLEIEPKFSHE